MVDVVTVRIVLMVDENCSYISTIPAVRGGHISQRSGGLDRVI
jgi:hypothetical protein